jgi:hypothetical protein
MASDLVDHHLEQLFAHIDVFTVLFHHLAPVTLLMQCCKFNTKLEPGVN